MKNVLAQKAMPEVLHLRAKHAASSVGLIERKATAGETPTVRVMTAISHAAFGGFTVVTVVQYQPETAWIELSREWSGDLPRATKRAYSESRKGFKTAVSRAFAASLHNAVYVPDTQDIDC